MSKATEKECIEAAVDRLPQRPMVSLQACTKCIEAAVDRLPQQLPRLPNR